MIVTPDNRVSLVQRTPEERSAYLQGHRGGINMVLNRLQIKRNELQPFVSKDETALACLRQYDELIRAVEAMLPTDTIETKHLMVLKG